jgi:hypothetical protein
MGQPETPFGKTVETSLRETNEVNNMSGSLAKDQLHSATAAHC